MTPSRILLAVLLATFGAHLSSALGQQAPATRAMRLRKVVFHGAMPALISTLASEYEVNIGLETEPLQPQPEVQLDLTNVTFDDILNGIVEAQPHYQWQRHNGFIDIYPKEGSCPLLDTTIDYFQVDNKSWTAASEALTSLPEVDSQMRALRLSRHDPPREERPSRSLVRNGWHGVFYQAPECNLALCIT